MRILLQRQGRIVAHICGRSHLVLASIIMDSDVYDRKKAAALARQVGTDFGASMAVALAYVGDRLGIFRALAQGAALTTAEIAAQTGLNIAADVLEGAENFVEAGKDTVEIATELSLAIASGEFEVLQLLGEGKGTRQIADQMHLSNKTVEAHRANIKRKLNLKTGPELVRYAVRFVETQK